MPMLLRKAAGRILTTQTVTPRPPKATAFNRQRDVVENLGAENTARLEYHLRDSHVQ